METPSIPHIAATMYPLLEPLDPQDRIKATSAVLAMFGQSLVASAPVYVSADVSDSQPESYGFQTRLASNAQRSLKQHQLSVDGLTDIFEFSGADVALLAADMPGSTKKDRTINCYLVVGVWALLRTDEPVFDDETAVQFCKTSGAYDGNNHTANRRALANRIIGDRKYGFRLTAPGLRDAANVIKSMISS